MAMVLQIRPGDAWPLSHLAGWRELGQGWAGMSRRPAKGTCVRQACLHYCMCFRACRVGLRESVCDHAYGAWLQLCMRTHSDRACRG